MHADAAHVFLIGWKTRPEASSALALLHSLEGHAWPKRQSYQRHLCLRQCLYPTQHMHSSCTGLESALHPRLQQCLYITRHMHSSSTELDSTLHPSLQQRPLLTRPFPKSMICNCKKTHPLSILCTCKETQPPCASSALPALAAAPQKNRKTLC